MRFVVSADKKNVAKYSFNSANEYLSYSNAVISIRHDVVKVIDTKSAVEVSIIANTALADVLIAVTKLI